MGLAHGHARLLQIGRGDWHRDREWRYACRMGANTDCELCNSPGGDLLWEDALCRIVRVTDTSGEAFPGMCRVILKRHIAEMSDLDSAASRRLMDVVFATERAVRHAVQPDKINLASLGNVVPHLHWHIVPRWRDDSHFPAPIWAAAKRAPIPRDAGMRDSLRRAIETELQTLIDSP